MFLTANYSRNFIITLSAVINIKAGIVPTTQNYRNRKVRLMYIQWKKSYETNHPLIDVEHRLLVMLFRKLDVAIKTGETETTVLRIVQEVKRYVKFHFTSEENLMYETNYPGIEGHIAIHTHLLVDLNNMLGKLTIHREFPEDVLDFLSDWLTNHIAHHDQLLAKHVTNATDRPVAELIYPEYLQAIIAQDSIPD